MAIIKKKSQITNVGEEVEKLELTCIFGGMQKGAAALEKRCLPYVDNLVTI